MGVQGLLLKNLSPSPNLPRLRKHLLPSLKPRRKPQEVHELPKNLSLNLRRLLSPSPNLPRRKHQGVHGLPKNPSQNLKRHLSPSPNQPGRLLEVHELSKSLSPNLRRRLSLSLHLSER